MGLLWTILKRGHAALALALALSALAAPAARAELSGSYFGLDAAEGMTLRIARQGEGFTGEFRDGRGGATPFEANDVLGAAEAALTIDGGAVVLRMEEEPLGAQVVMIPLAPDGALLTDRARAFIFLREGAALPEKPERYLPPPQRVGQSVAPEVFIDSYPFWPPDGVALGWEGTPARYRSLIRLFPAVQTDILWKMCKASQRRAGLAEALRGQGVLCADVVSAIDGARERGQFVRYKAEVDAEREQLLTAISCSTDYRRNSPTCKASARRTAEAAVALGTAATVIARYR